jgi:hypothetical protein
VLVSRSAAAVLVLASALFACAADAPATGRVHIVSAVLVYDGSLAIAAIDVHVDAAREATTFSWRVGALPSHGLCGLHLGWRLDLDETSNTSTELPANEARDVRLRATSRDRPACDAEQVVARCGEPVSLLVMNDTDDVVAALDTTFECLFPARPLR